MLLQTQPACSPSRRKHHGPSAGASVTLVAHSYIENLNEILGDFLAVSGTSKMLAPVGNFEEFFAKMKIILIIKI